MATILILGAGVMGSSLAVPAADNGHRVRLATTPLDADVLADLRTDMATHPRLRAPLPSAIEVVDAGDLGPTDGADAELIVIGVSSPGIGWAVNTIARLNPAAPIALVTKGLVATDGRPDTYADALPAMLAAAGLAPSPLIGIGGPCIARELAERRPTAVVFASTHPGAAEAMKSLLETPYYRISTSTDAPGVEACAALKNFYAIGVSAMLSRHMRGEESTKNPVAAAFQQAVDELALLAPWLGGARDTAFGLSGVGDLHVTVGGGRNSRLGRHLGTGATISEVMEGPMKGETVEGVDVGRVLGPPLHAAFASGALRPASFPLATALIRAIETGTTLNYDVAVGETANSLQGVR